MTESHFSGPSADQPIAEVLQAWPQTMTVFLRRRMACPGCAMAPFMTVAEAAEAYGMQPADLMAEFARAIAGEAVEGPFQPPLPHDPAVCTR
ncbi:MAG TPA: DUF1858 domain-containing protein [Azospirillum sp.]|nr:DUF1858 domain-containing protein [Azospirillum sp.]